VGRAPRHLVHRPRRCRSGAGPRIDAALVHDRPAGLGRRRAARVPSIFEERKFAEGSFATLLGCELEDLGGPTPSWRAVALGDVVLFHVRRRRLLVEFPPLGVGDFGLDPDGVHTGPAALPLMMRRISFAQHDLRAGDQLFLATDALAEWIVRAREDQGDDRVWRFLSRIGHPDAFARFVADSRAARVMRNDDVTLMRVLVSGSAPDRVVVCL